MSREFKFFQRNSGKNPTTNANNENLPLEQTVSSASQQDADPSRLPFSAIQEPERNPRFGLDQETHLRRKREKTPSKCQAKWSDQFFQSRTPNKLPASKVRFGWVPIFEHAGLASPERLEYSLHQGQFQLPPPPPIMANHVLNLGNGYSAATARSIPTGGRASSVHSGTSSTQSTPTKSVSKPMINGVSNSRAPQCCRTVKAMNFLVSSKGIPLSSAPPPVYASVEVPHFELKEDPSFWMDHNVQVVIRVRPINTIERSQQGYSRCVKQESAQSITWIGQSETRFMFDYIACETVNQEMLFRVVGLPMVENCMSGYNSCVFAYGQTGSGKTHTMLGEINDLEIRPSTNRGMTPRIFEFLFARIKAEEESRRDEKLKYTCKCSFLEIYNEQIFDLLNPTSTNLLIREDLRKGVHVENLSEFEVENVYDTLQLLIQGATNRKVAATMMNRESSRSHSVFTCTIESRWQKDSTSTLRFARLNLVDLAGSERQKTSGAEGDRLKEASNINKSLSTLGHVIMVLADLANGKQRHVPYRDSRLTFLLQDSLGGNSKTTIIANVSPSICSANETLSTLKFAQRAKVIQNNAVVNENASGDVFALQHQIHLLKEELSMLKQQNISRSLSFRTTTLENADYDAYSPQKLTGILSEFNQISDSEELQDVRVLNKQLKSFEALLAGAFRREKMAAISIRQLEAEIEQLNRLVRQREEDSQCSKLMIKFREDKIYRIEALLNGLIPSESYLREENNALSEEIKLLRTKIDRNPEVTRFASENIRLLEELRKFQDFYDEGERGLLLTELSELRNQLAQFLDGKLKSDINAQDLCLASPKKVPCSCSPKHVEEVSNLEQELDILKTIIAVEKSSRVEAEKKAFLSETELSITNDKLLQINKRYDATTDKLKDTRSVIEALESQQMLSINELEELRENNIRLADTVKIQEQQISTMKKQLALRIDVGNRKSIIAHEVLREDYFESECSSPFQDKLKRVQASLEKAWNLNMRCQSDQASHSSSEREMDEVRRQVEAETAEVIVCLQEELTTVNQIVDECNKNELVAKQRLMDLEKEKKEQDDKLYLLTLENIRLARLTEEKEQNASSIMEHWEQLAIEISDLLENGKTQLDNATHEVASISDICSQKSWITEQFGKIIIGISKRDSLIEELHKNLEDVCYVRHDMESKLMTLRGAILAITEAQQQENSDKESRILQLTSLLAEKTSIISELEDKVEDTVRKVRKAEICAAIFFIIVMKLYEINKIRLQALGEANLQLRESESAIPQKDYIIQGHASLLSIEGKGCQDQRAQVEHNYQQANSLEHWKDGCLDTSLKNEEGKITTPDSSYGLVEAKMKLREFQMQMSTLKSCMHEYADNQSMVLDQKKNLYEDLQKEICCFKHENDKLESHVSTLTEKLILVEENKAIVAKQLENQLMENEVLKLRLMGMSVMLEELRSKYVVCKESDNMKTIAMERLNKELIDASNLIGQRDVLVEELQKDMSRIAHEKDKFESESYTLNEKLILVEENKVIVAEQLKNQLMENKELKLRLMEMSMELEELQGKYEVVCKESNNVKTIALERLKKELLDASILIGQRDVLVEELQKDMSRIAHEKEKFESEAYTLKEKLKLAKSVAEKNEAVETESPQRKLLMENEQLKLQLEHMIRMLHEVKTLNQNLQEEFEDKMSSAILQKKLHDSLSERSNVLEEFQNELTVITHSKEQLESQMSILKEKLKLAESIVVVNKVVAIEARQIAEERRSYAQVKEEEVKLLERSIEELECTVNALQEQVKIVKGEAERQRIQRNELEKEEEAKRQLKENLSELENAQNSIQLLQMEATEKELELVQCKSIISELNLHAEAQASEYNRKFKELEGMAFQLKTEIATSNTTNPTSTKSEKGAAKSRGSGSPFKCIVGLAQQISTEKDEELTVARCKIEELEALAASRQNQIFMLNIRLAAAESMTHDVLRDLLGIKLDMTKYAKMNGGSHSDDSMKEKDKELGEQKRKVDEFVKERKSLLEEINRRREELIAAQIRLGKLEENEEFLSTENELLKADNAKYKNIVMELEEELEKNSINLNMQ